MTGIESMYKSFPYINNTNEDIMQNPSAHTEHHIGDMDRDDLRFVKGIFLAYLCSILLWGLFFLAAKIIF